MLPIPKRFESYTEIEDFVDQNIKENQEINLPDMITRINRGFCLECRGNDYETNTLCLRSHLLKMIDLMKDPECKLYYINEWAFYISRQSFLSQYNKYEYGIYLEEITKLMWVVLREDYICSQERNFEQGLGLVRKLTEKTYNQQQIINDICKFYDSDESLVIKKDAMNKKDFNFTIKQENNQNQKYFTINGNGNAVGDNGQVSNNNGVSYNNCTFNGGVPSVPTTPTQSASTKQDEPKKSDDDLPSWLTEPLPF